MEWLFGVKGGLDGFLVVRPGSTGKGREGVNPSPRDGGRKGFEEEVLLNHLSPKGLVGL